MTATDTLPAAGRELDRLVHERVMGICYTEYRSYGDTVTNNVRPYSTSIEAAWLVVERLREIGLGFIIGDFPKGWEVEITTTEDLYQQGYQGCYRIDATPALAICRAALAAVSREP